MNKKVSIAVISITVGAMLLLLLLPSLLSSDFFLRWIVSRINGLSEATVEVENCDIGWRQGLRCYSLKYIAPDSGLLLVVDQISGSKGLLALLAAPKNLGTFQVHHPVLTLSASGHPREKTAVTAPANVSRANEKETPQAPLGSASTPGTQQPPFWDALAMTMTVDEGRLVVTGPTIPSVVKGDFSGTSILRAGTANFDGQWQGRENQGQLLVNGFVDLPTKVNNALDTLVTKVKLKAKELQVAPILDFISQKNAAVPNGAGLLTAELAVSTAGTESIDILGKVACRDVELVGGFLGQDHVRLKTISAHIDGNKKSGNEWQLADLHLDGDPGKVSAQGTFDKDGGQAQVSGTLFLPVLFAQLPHLLQMQQSAHVTTGDLKFSSVIEQTAQVQRISANASVASLQGEVKNQPFSWENGVRLLLAAERSGERIAVDQLDVTTVFMQVSGKGSLQDFSLQGHADLQKASQHLGQLFSLPWSGGGTVTFHARSQMTDTKRYAMDFQLESPNLVVRKNQQELVPEHPLQIKGTVSAPPTWLWGKGGADLQVNSSGWPGSFDLTVDNLQRSKGLATARYNLSSTMHLNRLSDVLHTLQIVPRKTTLAGEVNLAVAGFFTEKQVGVRSIDLQADDFFLLHGGTILQEDHILLQTKRPLVTEKVPVGIRPLSEEDSMTSWLDKGGGLTSVDRDDKRLFVRDIMLRSTSADLDLDVLTIDDVFSPLHSWRLDCHGQVNLDRLSSQVKKNNVLPASIRLSGQSRFALRVDQQKAPYPVRLSLLSPDFHLATEEKDLVGTGEVRLTSQVNGRLHTGDIHIEKLDVVTPPLHFSATGRLQRSTTPHLVLKGEQTVHMAELSQILLALTGKQIDLQGDRPAPFELDTTLEGNVLNSAHFAAAFWVKQINWAGVTGTALNLPLRWDSGTIETGVHGGLAGGKLNLDTTYLAKGEPPALSLPTGSKVLTDVQLDGPLSDGLLARIHPLFGILTRPSGTVDARVEELYWPVMEKGAEQARLRIVFDVSEVQLDSYGVLKQALDFMNLGDQPLTLDESEITCLGERGRISCTPVKILIADSTMTMSGSVGIDQSIDYLLEIPVTERLVGREGYRVLKGATIKVPLRGSLRDPDFNKNMISKAIADVVNQAAGKAIEQQVEKLVPGLLEGIKL